MATDFLVWFGYFASGVIALSMTMSSIIKFRWINLVGAFSFSLYGFLLTAYPVMALNGFIFFVDIFYLRKAYSKKHLFDSLEVRGDNKYLLKFLSFYEIDIKKFFPDFNYIPEQNNISFIILRNMAVAGIFLAKKIDSNSLEVQLDYSIPEYRDYKNGRFVFLELRSSFTNMGYNKIISHSTATAHQKYLIKLGFVDVGQNKYQLILK